MSSPGNLDPEILEGCASLLGEIDKRLLVVLRDGRTLIGTLRSVDQFANLILQKSVERIHVGKSFGDIPRGIFIVRGDNVELIGEIDSQKEMASTLRCISIEAILAAQRQEQEEKARQEAKKADAFKQRGMYYLPESSFTDE